MTSKEQVRNILTSATESMTVKEIASIACYSESTVRKALKALGAEQDGTKGRAATWTLKNELERRYEERAEEERKTELAVTVSDLELFEIMEGEYCRIDTRKHAEGAVLEQMRTSTPEITAGEMWERAYGKGGSKRPHEGRGRAFLAKRCGQMTSVGLKQVGAAARFLGKATAVIGSFLLSPHSAGWETLR